MSAKSEITAVPPWYVAPLAKAVYVAVAAGIAAWGGYAASAKEPVVAPVVAPLAPQVQTAPLPAVAPPAVLQERLDATDKTVQRIENKLDGLQDDVTEIKIGLARLAPRSAVTNVGKNP